MATVSRAALTCCMAGVLLIPVTLVLFLQGISTSPAHALPTDDFGDGIRVTFDPAASVNISSVVDDEGDIHVVWEDFRSGNGDVYYVKLDEEGNKLTNDAKISNDSAMSRHPSVAVDDSDHIFIVWESVENGSAELYFAKLWYYAGNITFEYNGLRVSDADPANSTEPEISICTDGSLAVVWTDARDDVGDGNREIYYKRLSTTGAAITADVRVTGDFGVSERPRMDIDSAGNVHIVWYDFRDSDNGQVINHGVFYRKVTPNGVPMTNETRITFASPSSSPDVAVDTDGNVHVVFDDDRYAAFDVFYTLLDSNGMTLVDDRVVSAKDDNESRFPRISLSDSRVVDTVWQDSASGVWAIHYSAMVYNGSLEVFDQPISDMGSRNATGPIVMCAKDNNTLVTFVGGVPNEELFFLRTHRADIAITGGDVSLSDTQPLEGSTILVNLTVRNLVGEAASDLVVGLLIDGEYIAEESIDSLLAGATAAVSFSYTVKASDSSVTVVLDPYQSIRETDESNNAVTIPITVRIPGVELSADPISRSVEPGQSALFNLTIENTGSYAADYNIANSAIGDGWSVDLEAGSVLTIPPTNSTSFLVNVSVPEGVSPGVRTLNISATCTDRTSVNDTLTLMVDVRRAGAITVIAPAGCALEPTVPINLTFLVTNAANSNESFEVEAIDDRGWITSVSRTDLTLVPGETVEVGVIVTPSRYDPPGTLDTLTVRLESKNLSTNTGEGSVLLMASHHREIDLSLSQQAFVNYSLPEDRQIIYSIGVSNLGNSDETVKVWLSGLDSFWAVLNTSYVFLDPGQNDTVRLTMTPGLYVLAGAYIFNVSASSESDPTANDTLVMGVNVQPFYDIETYLDLPVVSPDGSEYLTVNMTVENWGNSIDVVDFYGYSETLNGTILVIGGNEYDIATELPPPSTLEPGNREVVKIMLQVPKDAEPGLYTFLVDVYSLNDPTAVSSEVVTLLIPERESFFNIYTILAIAGAAATAAAMVAFLILRKRVKEREAVAAEQRRRMQQKRGSRQGKRPMPKNRRPASEVRERNR
ncbi:MAG: hypothetical protein JSV94_01045 [Methanobacteriota archaeon]|nr:MAG: hypothetical protein JSV94_01045 [Euryarchaeota archaeon]